MVFNSKYYLNLSDVTDLQFLLISHRLLRFVCEAAMCVYASYAYLSEYIERCIHMRRKLCCCIMTLWLFIIIDRTSDDGLLFVLLNTPFFFDFLSPFDDSAAISSVASTSFNPSCCQSKLLSDFQQVVLTFLCNFFADWH